MNKTQTEFGSNSIIHQYQKLESNIPDQLSKLQMNKTFSNFKTPQRKRKSNNWGSMSGRQVGKKTSPNRDYDISFVSGIKSS